MDKKLIKNTWKELMYALKKLWIKSVNGYVYESKDIKISFHKDPSNKEEISIYSNDKDFRNRYYQDSFNPKQDKYWNWEIILYEDGTWTIK